MCIGAGALAVIGTLASVAGTVVTGVAQRNAYKAQEQQNKNNAIIAERNAADARQRGVVAEQEVQMRTRGMIGKQLNILSERNIATSTGSPLDIIGDTAMFGKLDALTTRTNYEREAIAHESQAMNFNAAAEQARMGARAATFGTGVSLFSTALGGITDYRKATAPQRMTL